MQAEQTNEVGARDPDVTADSGQKGAKHQFQHNRGGGYWGKNDEENQGYSEARYTGSKHIWKSSSMVTVYS